MGDIANSLTTETEELYNNSPSNENVRNTLAKIEIYGLAHLIKDTVTHYQRKSPERDYRKSQQCRRTMEQRGKDGDGQKSSMTIGSGSQVISLFPDMGFYAVSLHYQLKRVHYVRPTNACRYGL